MKWVPVRLWSYTSRPTAECLDCAWASFDHIEARKFAMAHVRTKGHAVRVSVETRTRYGPKSGD